MPSDVTYSIPVKSHVFKFICAHVDVDPFKVCTTNEFGILLFMSLDWKPNFREDRLNYSERLTIRIPKYHGDKNGYYISNRKLELFNEMIERMMRRELFAMLNQGNQSKGDIQRIIHKFRDFYGINDLEMDYHTLRRAYHRDRSSVNTFL